MSGDDARQRYWAGKIKVVDKDDAWAVDPASYQPVGHVSYEPFPFVPDPDPIEVISYSEWTNRLNSLLERRLRFHPSDVRTHQPPMTLQWTLDRRIRGCVTGLAARSCWLRGLIPVMFTICHEIDTMWVAAFDTVTVCRGPLDECMRRCEAEHLSHRTVMASPAPPSPDSAPAAGPDGCSSSASPS